MGFFSRGPTPPELRPCLICSEEHPNELADEHYKTHLISVTDNNGYAAFTFECPRCGPMPLAWGGGKNDPYPAPLAAIKVHMMERHRFERLLGSMTT